MVERRGKGRGKGKGRGEEGGVKKSKKKNGTGDADFFTLRFRPRIFVGVFKKPRESERER